MRSATALCLTMLLPAPRIARGESAPTVDAVLDSLTGLVEFRDVQISPDGKHVAWVEAVPGKAGPLPDRSIIQVVTLGSARSPALRISAGRPGAHDEREIRWSPDGEHLAFLSNAARRSQVQLYVADLRTGRARKLTNLTGTLADPRWSPDGKRLAFRFIEGELAKGPMGATARDMGVVQETIHESRITVVDPAGGRALQVSPADLFIYEYEWSPDGASWVATGAHGSGDDNWWVAELYVISASSGQARSVLKPKFQMANPSWSPDGKSIALIGGLMSDEGVTGGDIFVLPASGGEPKNLTAGRRASPSSLSWPKPDQIIFAEWVDGDSGIAALQPSSGKVESLWSGAEHVGCQRYSVSLSLAADGSTSAIIRESFQHPPEVFAGAIGSWIQLSQRNQRIHASWGGAKKVHWKTDGFEEQGWLLSPARIESGRNYPLVTIVHGGPAFASPPLFVPLWGTLAARNYFVFLPNPRGSYGQGEAFTGANVKDLGHGDLRDILAGVDAAVQSAPIDPDRIGIYGWSYGGFMAMWAVTQTQRFRAAVAGAGIANWQSYYGQNRIDQWMIPYFGASVYDDPGAYARSSPIHFVKQARTPTLMLQGERDAEVPAPQSYEFWHALKALGVPTQLVIYPDEGHIFTKPEHRRDVPRRIVAWFDRYLSPSEPSVAGPK